jgi:hypothetical protein
MMIFALFPVTLLVLVCEGLTTAAIHRDFRIEKDPSTGRSTYVFRMGRYPWSHVSRITLNAMGFPDEDFENLPPKGECTHVVFAGDSYTFGDGVDGEKGYVSLVRARAAARFPNRCIRLFNVGERATTIDRHAQNLERTWSLLEPDIVILGQYQNDLSDLTKPWLVTDSAAAQTPAAGRGRRWLPFNLRVPLIGVSMNRWLTYQTLAGLTVQGIHYDLLARWSVLADPNNRTLAAQLKEQYSTLYASTIDRIRSRGAEVGVVIVPSKFDVLAGHSPEEEFFLDLARAKGVPALALFRNFDARRSPYPYLTYDGHLNERGNELVADAVMAWLFDGEVPVFRALASDR